MDIRARGITRRPVPLRFVLKCKRHPDGTYDKHRARLVICGHKGFMPRHEYKDTFAASPDIETSRLVQVLALISGWNRLAFDISVAYLQSAADSTFEVPVMYPKGYEMTGDDGESLLAVLQKPLYGHPEAARAWSDTRNAWMAEKFNQDGWTAKQSDVDAALWIVTAPVTGNTILMVIYTDDCDCVGPEVTELEQIKEAFHDRFGVTDADPAFMLGVKRDITVEDDGTRVLTYSMAKFIESTYEKFQGDMGGIILADTPLPHGTLVGAQQPDHVPDEAEQARYRKKGYLSIVGGLLWAARQCHPEIMGHVAMLCSVMACPSASAYNAALTVLKWLYHHRHEGMRYRSDGNIEPVMYYDSGHNQFADGRAMYMYELMIAGGPVAVKAKKHERVRDSTSYSEYAAQHEAGICIEWCRNIITQIGTPFTHLIAKPTLLLGDNDVATNTAKGTVSSKRTKHWDLYLHMNKQRVRDGSTEPERVPSPDNNSDVGTKCQADADFLRLTPRLKGYAESYIPPEYNLLMGPFTDHAFG